MIAAVLVTVVVSQGAGSFINCASQNSRYRSATRCASGDAGFELASINRRTSTCNSSRPPLSIRIRRASLRNRAPGGITPSHCRGALSHSSLAFVITLDVSDGLRSISPQA